MTILDSSKRRSAMAGAILLLSLALTPACKKHKVTVETTEEGRTLASVISAADPNAASQFVSGFYGVEQGSWRWTSGRFSVLLRPPRTAAAKGATLQLKFTLPQVALDKMKSVTLSANLSGTALPPETYTKAGDYTYTRDVAPNVLDADAVRVDFMLDKTVPPSVADQRELGLVVSMAGLQPKVK